MQYLNVFASCLKFPTILYNKGHGPNEKALHDLFPKQNYYPGSLHKDRCPSKVGLQAGFSFPGYFILIRA